MHEMVKQSNRIILHYDGINSSLTARKLFKFNNFVIHF